MKILTVAIPNHHFFQWVNQLEGLGHEVFWFDVTDGGPRSEKISWVTQIKGWKLKWDFPLRSSTKRRFPKFYNKIQQWNEHPVKDAFAKAYQQIQPDIVHCFEMQLAGLPILSVLQGVDAPLIYSSWGSDLFDFKRLGVTQEQATAFLNRADFLITDCKRDQAIAKENGFNGISLGVFPGNGGLDVDHSHILKTAARDAIMIKGYEDGVGKASIILDALELVNASCLEGRSIIVYSADRSIESQIESSDCLSSLDITAYSRHRFIENSDLLEMMGTSSLHIANSLSDGMPNALLESMGMGAFPIQSNPGKVSAEVIEDGKNGFLINDPLDAKEITSLIEKALDDELLRKRAQEINTLFIHKNYNRVILQPQIVALYQHVNSNHRS